MKMTTRVAFDNMKYGKSKNILIGIAIFLTTMLLFIVPTVGKGFIDLQFAATNELYPSWHALYRNVDSDTARQLAAHHDISRYGLRSDAGYFNLKDARISMMYMDKVGMELYRINLAEGQYPQEEDEIVISPGILHELGQEGGIGDTITVPYQIFRNGELDLTQKKEFRISGFLEDSDTGLEQRAYTALISEAFLKEEIPGEELSYRFLLQIKDTGDPTTDDLEIKINNIAKQFGIPENNININSDYLMANYVDPSTLPAIVIIMAIIMLAGAITVYSIYYVSMSQRIQEFGKLKAIGATRRQIRQIVLREGLCIAALAIPAGLLIGTPVSKAILKAFTVFANRDSQYMSVLTELLETGKVSICSWWIYLLAAIVTLGTVYFSLVRPMHVAAKVSEVEAMRMQDTGKNRKSCRKGYEYLSVSRLTWRNLTQNKRKCLITILSMAATGIFLMVVATVTSCANPKESAGSSIVGQYEVSPVIEENNKEHPERKWTEIQKNNPMDETLKNQIEELPGVDRVDAFTNIQVTGDPFDEANDVNFINGIPEEYARELEKSITRGQVTYEELKSGDKVIIDRALLHWYPDLDIGQKLNLTIHDGDRSYNKEIEIAAIGNYGSGLTNYAYLLMAKEAADSLCENNSVCFYHVIADQDYDPALEKSLRDIVNTSGRLEMRTWKEQYDHYKSSMTITSGACYAFLGVLAVISILNLINTMINSVHVRKKELGMMQAIGMSDSQLMKMLQMEGLFYTLGTLVISIGLGSLAGYPVFLYAKEEGLFEITTYHYPLTAAIVISVVLLLIQVLLAAGLSRSVRKNSLIERIRFSE
ncbi:MAG: ABC transporter permease [Dorea sp.]|nr:ABC transporter permease [Dorea sp.]